MIRVDIINGKKQVTEASFFKVIDIQFASLKQKEQRKTNWISKGKQYCKTLIYR